MSAQPQLPPECSSIVLAADVIAARTAELGAVITERYGGSDLRLVTVLRGGLFFLADLARAIEAPCTLDFLSVASYVPGQGGAVRVTKDLDDAVEGATVILVEDVVDTGLTVNYVRTFLASHRPERVEICTLLDKPARRIAEVPIALRGFEMSDRFLVGYGLDLHGRHRNLPYVAELAEEAVFG